MQAPLSRASNVFLALGFRVPVLRKFSHALSVVAIALPLSGCATSLMDGLWGDDSSSATTSTAGMTAGVAPDMSGTNEGAEVAKLYNEGLSELASGQNKSAIKAFAEVERQYPYSSAATKSIIMQAYASYRAAKWDDAIVAANRFITLHPGHKDTGYAYYLIAVSNYNKISDTKRDQSATKQALASLEEVAQRFPGTPYAADATEKVKVARDHLAGAEMEVGRYYYRQGSYLAGINRFKRVVTEYKNTNQTPEALYRLSEGYMALGVVSEAQTAAAVLGHNYPNSEWYKDAYQLVSSDGQAPVENEESWISKTFSSLNPL
jgi:outer membrane protein assembly factor BamD